MRGRPSKYLEMLRDREVARWYGQVSQGSRKTAKVYLRRLGYAYDRYGTTPRAVTKLDRREIRDFQKLGSGSNSLATSCSTTLPEGHSEGRRRRRLPGRLTKWVSIGSRQLARTFVLQQPVRNHLVSMSVLTRATFAWKEAGGTWCVIGMTSH